MDNREILLNLTPREKQERDFASTDFFYFLGKCRTTTSEAISNPLVRGQSWLTSDDADYIPTQDIRNKVKPLLKKQARFMFGRSPELLLKPYNSKDKKKCEELRQFLDQVLEDNHFWSETLKAFLMCTVTKRVLLRIEADPEAPIRLFYHTLDEFSYTVDPKDYRKLRTVTIVNKTIIDESDETKNKWNRYTYYMNDTTKTCWLRIEIFNTQDIDNPESTEERNTLLGSLPAWLIVNGGLLGDLYGESDLTDLKDPQNQYNRKNSDFADALRFQMFGQTVIVDATKKSVDEAVIAPNALLPLESIDEDHTANAFRMESSFSNADAVEKFLTRSEADMYETLDIPRPEQLINIPSAKSLKYMYNDLIARCEEKWLIWEPIFKNLVQYIIQSTIKFRCYSNWNKEWETLEYSIIFKHNYPIPEDIEDRKKLAIEEVDAHVRSIRSYVREFSDEEDPEETMKEIIEDLIDITSAQNDQFANVDPNNIDTNNPEDNPLGDE